MDLNTKAALISAVRQAEKPVAFLVGAPLSLDSDGRGVPDVTGMLDLIREEVRLQTLDALSSFEDAIRESAGAAAYQAAMGWLQAWVSQDAVNRVVGHAVLKACLEPAAFGSIESPTSDGEPGQWHIPSGTQALGKLLCDYYPDFPGPILTTNFDPLLSLAIRSAGGRTSRRILHADGTLPSEIEEEPDVRTVVHLHGYWRMSDTLQTATQLESHRPRLRASLQRLLRKRTLIVVAYGGWDDVFTGALTGLLDDDQAELDVIWCFYEKDPAIVEARYSGLLKAVAPAIARGRLRTYGGIDCHRIFSEISEAVRGEARRTYRTDSPLTGWEWIDQDYLSRLAPLRDDEVLRFFDGAIPSWRHAVSDAVPRREIVSQLHEQLESARATGDTCTLNAILAAGGEGKSTVLRQVAADICRTPGWSVLWRPRPDIRTDSEQVACLDPGKCWLLVTDDADNLAADVYDCAARLNELGRSNTHFLLAARDPDWRAAGGYRRGWASLLRLQPYTILRGVTHEDAQRIVRAWASFGEPGLKALSGVSDGEQRSQAFEQAVASEQGKGTEGSFFGGLLEARLGEDGLQAHVREFLGRLREIEIDGSPYSLFDALMYIASCHAVGIPGIDEVVLADLLVVPRNHLYTRVVRPLGEEATAVRSGRHVFTRHPRVAAAVLIEADAALGVDLPELWAELVRQTIVTARETHVGHQSHPKIVHAGPRLQEALPSRIPAKGRGEVAIAAATAAVQAEPNRISYLVDISRTYRQADRVVEAVSLCRKNLRGLETKEDYRSDVRGYWYEWGVCEGKLGDERGYTAIDVWIMAISASDHLDPAPLTKKQIMHICAGLGLALGKLIGRQTDCLFARARRAAACIGMLTDPDRTGKALLEKHRCAADALGTPWPANTEQMLDWLEAGVKAAWRLVEDDFIRSLTDPLHVTFHGLGDFCRSRADRKISQSGSAGTTAGAADS